jgi:hypothetical protein
MKRKSFSRRDRARIFEKEKGICHICGGLVHVGERWEISHEIPLAAGGKDIESNRRVAHFICHRVHTSNVDIPTIAKCVRNNHNHLGIKKIPQRKIQSRGFPKTEKVRNETTKIVARKPLYRSSGSDADD